MTIRLRRATVSDVVALERWETDPVVIAATTDDGDQSRAFGGLDWHTEIGDDSDASYHLIAELDGRPIGAMQIIDPHMEPTHYWGSIEPSLRAIDIWIGDEGDRNRGYGSEMMQLAQDLCFADSSVTAIVIDPLASNTRAHAFYHRLGYVTVDRRLFGEDDCLVLRLERATTGSPAL